MILLGLSDFTSMGEGLLTRLKWALPLWVKVYLLGLSGLEPPTSRLSGVRSNRLSYKPFFLIPVQYGYVHFTFVQ